MKIFERDRVRSVMTWDVAVQAIWEGHRGARPRLDDMFVSDGPFSLFGRATILPGRGAGVKVASIYPPNVRQSPPRPAESAIFVVIDEVSKEIAGILDGPEVTRWKVAADSALGSKILSRPESETLLVLGGGPVAAALAEAHLSVRPSIRRLILWNRTPERLAALASALARPGLDVEVAASLPDALPLADIVSSATGATVPLISGRLLRPGCHVDLVGGFQRDMREADDAVVQRASIYVDNSATAIDGTGDIGQPLAEGKIARSDILGDLFDLASGAVRPERKDITLYKNAGGAHLDLMLSLAVLSQDSTPQ